MLLLSGIEILSMAVNKEYRLVDVVKMVMAIIVIAIHTHPQLSSGSTLVIQASELLYSLAVPFFFMASGFLLFKKIDLPLDDDGNQRIKRYLLKIVKLYLLWTAIYLPLSVLGFVNDGTSLLKSALIFIRNVLFVGENYMSWPLWYLLALIVAVLIIWGLLKLRISRKAILLLSIITAFIGVGLNYCHENGTLQTLTDAYFSIFVKTRNGLFVGFMYVALGMICSYGHKNALLVEIICLILGVVGLALNFPLANAFVVYALFSCVSRIDGKVIRRESAQFCRSLSTIVYLIHMYFVALLVYVFDMQSGFPLFVITSVASVATGSVMLLKSSKIVDVIFKG